MRHEYAIIHGSGIEMTSLRLISIYRILFIESLHKIVFGFFFFLRNSNEIEDVRDDNDDESET